MPAGAIRRKNSAIPFAATACDKAEQVVALAAFLVALCAVYINSSMIHISLILSL